MSKSDFTARRMPFLPLGSMSPLRLPGPSAPPTEFCTQKPRAIQIFGSPLRPTFLRAALPYFSIPFRLLAQSASTEFRTLLDCHRSPVLPQFSRLLDSPSTTRSPSTLTFR